MKKFCTIFTLFLLSPWLSAAPSTEEVVAKARAFLGGDEALDAIRSIYYEAQYVTAEGDEGTIRIIFQKPLQQRVEVLRGEMGEVTALNDFDGWRKAYDVNDTRRWSMTLLDSTRIRELQANTWENLNFFRGIEQRRGRIENLGVTEVDGRSCVQLVFHHPREVKFTRFFDVETGRLLMTRTHEGAEIRETGEIRVDGVLFPEKITMSRGGVILNEIHFKEVKLNQKFEDSLFDIPLMAP